MNHPPGSLGAALETVRVHSPTAYSVLGRTYRTEAPALATALAEELYVSLHCRTPDRSAAMTGFTDWIGARAFVDRLSGANCGLGTWQGGWVVRRIEPDGRIVVQRHHVRFWVSPEGFRSPGGPVAVGQAGAVLVPKEYRTMVPGFYLALGDEDVARDAGNIVRVYWHIAPRGAEPLVGRLTGGLNRARIPFQLKVLAEPLRYQRCDPAVLYLPRPAYQRALPILAGAYHDLVPWIKSPVSLLVKPLAPGLGLAEDPGDRTSFGEHRTRLLAGILLGPEWSGADSASQRGMILERRLAAAGYALDALYLNPGSRDDFAGLGQAAA